MRHDPWWWRILLEKLLVPSSSRWWWSAEPLEEKDPWGSKSSRGRMSTEPWGVNPKRGHSLSSASNQPIRPFDIRLKFTQFLNLISLSDVRNQGKGNPELANISNIFFLPLPLHNPHNASLYCIRVLSFVKRGPLKSVKLWLELWVCQTFFWKQKIILRPRSYKCFALAEKNWNINHDSFYWGIFSYEVEKI